MNIFSTLSSRTAVFLLLISVTFIYQSCTTEPNNTYKYNDNTVRIRLTSEPRGLNPLLSPFSSSRVVFDHVFMQLMDFDPESLEMVPLLVKNKPIATSINDGLYKGGTAYTFEIREDAVWNDGSPVTAEDVHFSMKLVFAPGLPRYYRSYFEFVKKFETDPNNPKKFTIHTSNKYMLNKEVVSNADILQASLFDPEGYLKKYTLEQLNNPENAEKLAADEDLKVFAKFYLSPKFTSEPEGITGCGPYKFEKWESGQYILLTKKDNWWGEKHAGGSAQMQAYPDTLMFKIIPDQTAALSALKDQELDISSGIDSKDFWELQSNESIKANYNLHTPQTPSVYLININTRIPKLADPRVRKALAHLMDVDDFLKTLYYGYGKRITGPILSFQPYYNKSIAPIQYDLGKAKSLLADAGWADSDNDGILDKIINNEKTQLELEVLIGTSKASENIAVVFQNGLKKAGINLKITKKDQKEVTALVRKGEFELYPGGMNNDLIPFDPKDQWHSSSATAGGRNYTGFGNAMTDALIDSLRNTENLDLRYKMYNVFQEELYKSSPAIFLFNPLERIAVHKRFDTKISFKRPGYHPNTFKLDKK